ncbi:hypothetical protein AVEN_109775-1, partial [Araneus ventricosus]
NLRWRRRQNHLMDLPSGDGHGVGVGGVASPKALDEGGCRDSPPDHMFLALLLLDLQRESRAQNALQKETVQPIN